MLRMDKQDESLFCVCLQCVFPVPVAPQSLICKDPLPVVANSEVNVTCEFIAGAEVTFNLTLPNGEVVESENPRLGIYFEVEEKEVGVSYFLVDVSKISRFRSIYQFSF